MSDQEIYERAAGRKLNVDIEHDNKPMSPVDSILIVLFFIAFGVGLGLLLIFGVNALFPVGG